MRTYVNAFAGQARLAQGTQDRGKRRVGHATVLPQTNTRACRQTRTRPCERRAPRTRRPAASMRGRWRSACLRGGGDQRTRRPSARVDRTWPGCRCARAFRTRPARARASWWMRTRAGRVASARWTQCDCRAAPEPEGVEPAHDDASHHGRLRLLAERDRMLVRRERLAPRLVCRTSRAQHPQGSAADPPSSPYPFPHRHTRQQPHHRVRQKPAPHHRVRQHPRHRVRQHPRHLVWQTHPQTDAPRGTRRRARTAAALATQACGGASRRHPGGVTGRTHPGRR